MKLSDEAERRLNSHTNPKKPFVYVDPTPNRLKELKESGLDLTKVARLCGMGEVEYLLDLAECCDPTFTENYNFMVDILEHPETLDARFNAAIARHKVDKKTGLSMNPLTGGMEMDFP